MIRSSGAPVPVLLAALLLLLAPHPYGPAAHADPTEAATLLEEADALAEAGRLIDARDRLRDLVSLFDRERRLAAPDGKRALEEAQRPMLDAAWLLDDGIRPRRDETRTLACATLDALALHYRDRAREFRRAGYRREGERFDGHAKRAGSLAEPWREPREEPRGDRAFVEGFSTLTRNVVKAVDRGFRDGSHALDRSLDLSESAKRRERRARERERAR